MGSEINDVNLKNPHHPFQYGGADRNAQAKSACLPACLLRLFITINNITPPRNAGSPHARAQAQNPRHKNQAGRSNPNEAQQAKEPGIGPDGT